ncbi:hypothetical protein MOKP118_35280 [Mycobacterium avium subsp. hominissuis]
MQDAVGPHSAPPVARLGCRIAPQAAGGRDVVEARLPRPGQQPPAGVRFAAVGARDPSVEVSPQVERRQFGIPDEPRVVGVAHRHDAARPAHAPHLAQGGDRIGQVLEHLMGVDDIERVVGEVETVHVGGAERDVGQIPLLGFGAGHFQDVRRLVDGGDLPGRDPRGQVGGDGAGTATDVEHRQARCQVRQQVTRGVLGGTPPVTAQHRLVVPVRIRRSMLVVHYGPSARASLFGQATDVAPYNETPVSEYETPSRRGR